MSAKNKPLTIMEINALKPKEKRYRFWDEKGLYIEVTPNGSKLWRYKYRFQGKEKLLSFGPYPRVSLAEAREEREKAWKILSAGNDPAVAKKNTSANNTFHLIAEEWLNIKASGWSASHLSDTSQRLKNNVLPFIGKREINEITPSEILTVIRRIEARNTPEMAKKILGCCSQIFRYAVTTEKAASDPCRDLKGVLKSHKPKSYPAVTDPVETRPFVKYLGSHRSK